MKEASSLHGGRLVVIGGGGLFGFCQAVSPAFDLPKPTFSGLMDFVTLFMLELQK